MNVWRQFWDTEDLFRENNWRRNMDIFMRGADGLLPLDGKSRILDIGCGPGHLAESLAGHVGEYTGLDTSEKFIRECRERLAPRPSFHFGVLPSDYLDFSVLNGSKFDIIICLSVVQYYRDESEITRLINEVKKYAAPGARFLIADIIIHGSPHASYIKILHSARHHGFFMEQLKFMFRARFSSYYKTRSRTGLLGFTEKGLEEFKSRLNVHAEIRRDPLTLDPSRRHLLIHF